MESPKVRVLCVCHNVEVSIFGVNVARVIILQTLLARCCLIVVTLVQSSPHGIMTIFKGTTISVKLIRHDQFIFQLIKVVAYGLVLLTSV